MKTKPKKKPHSERAWAVMLYGNYFMSGVDGIQLFDSRQSARNGFETSGHDTPYRVVRVRIVVDEKQEI